MRRVRAVVAAIAVGAMSVPLTACAGQSGSERQIALLLPESKTARYESHDRPAFVDRVDELCAECETLASNAGQSASRQQAQAEAAITNGADVLVLDPVDSTSAAVIARHAERSGVPVMSYDRLVLDAPVAFHVTFDNERVGAIQAESLLDEISNGGEQVDGVLVVLNGSPTDDNAAQFRAGASAVFEDSGVPIGVEADIPDWSPDKAQEAMERALTTLGRNRIAGVYAANDGIASGAVAAMKAAGLDPLPPVTGQDAELAAVRRILTGEQHMTVYKAVRAQARVAAEIAVGLARDGVVPDGARTTWVDNGFARTPATKLEPLLVTRDTIATTVVSDGFWSTGEICADLERACVEAGLPTESS